MGNGEVDAAAASRVREKRTRSIHAVTGKWGLRGATHVRLRNAESKSVKKALAMARENLKAKKKLR